ncbi:MAG: nickel pincer cofactor biosynthesis protein LarC [Coriobacteriales bacterium]|nr:nickel pincer cofactor biosynthesis protein LarC [Coriobacteriales bacterium]
MTRELLLDCSAGVAGDMLIAALLDLGADLDVLRDALASLELEGCTTQISRVKKNGLDACDFEVLLGEDFENHDHDMEYLYGTAHDEVEHHQNHDMHHGHRTLGDVLAILSKGQLTDRASLLATQIFTILAESEAQVHGATKETVHFHEVGALDSIVDIVSVAVCIDNLGIDTVYVSELCEGSGTVRCAHGMMPVPVPAVAAIASAYAIPLRILDSVHGELVTPTGAACIAALRSPQMLHSAFTVEKVGLGAGKRNYPQTSGIVRAMLIHTQESATAKTLWKLECDIDDAPGEMLGHALDGILGLGAVEAHYLPIYTKKNRPAWQLQVICSEDVRPSVESYVFFETTTIGIRRIPLERSVLERSMASITTPFGPCDAKAVILPTRETRLYPEYKSVCNLAQTAHIPYQEAYRAALAACTAKE